MARNLKLYRRFIVMFLRAKMQYRYAFVVDLMIRMIWLSGVVYRGEFDIILTKPINPLFHVVSRQFDFPAFPFVLSSVVALAVLSARLHIAWTPLRIALFAGDIVGGFLIFGAVWVVVGSSSFRMVGTNAMSEILLQNARKFIEYPVDFYGKGIQSILTFLLPYSFVNYFPARRLLGSGDFSFFPRAFDWLTLAVGVVAFAAAYRFWWSSVKKYKSTGS